VAPTYPEQDETDLFGVLDEVKLLDPITVFHEPINERAGNVERMRELANEAGIMFWGDQVFDNAYKAAKYQIEQLRTVEKIATTLGIKDRLHLWPDKSLMSRQIVHSQAKPFDFEAWLNGYWRRVSEWPT
jgi:hypothetical protein